jgi:hypothetical protein
VFYILAILYLVTFFGSIYGLWADQLVFRYWIGPEYKWVISGWKKNSLCLLGLFIVLSILAYPAVKTIINLIKLSENPVD